MIFLVQLSFVMYVPTALVPRQGEFEKYGKTKILTIARFLEE
jgi:hypothetical protein